MSLNVTGWLRATYRLRDLDVVGLLDLANRARLTGHHGVADAALEEIKLRGLAS